MYYEHVFVHCDAFIFTISFLICLLSVLTDFKPWSTFSVINLRHVLSRLLGWVKVNKINWKGDTDILLMRLWSFTTYWDIMRFSPFSFSWFFIRVLLLDYFAKKCVYLWNIYYKYCWCMYFFLNIIKVLLVYNPKYSSCFPSGFPTRKFWCLIWYLNGTWKPTRWSSWQSNLKT